MDTYVGHIFSNVSFVPSIERPGPVTMCGTHTVIELGVYKRRTLGTRERKQGSLMNTFYGVREIFNKIEHPRLGFIRIFISIDSILFLYHGIYKNDIFLWLLLTEVLRL